MLTTTCPACGMAYRVPDSAAGKRTACKKCGEAFRIPSAASPPAVDATPRSGRPPGRPAAPPPPPPGTSPPRATAPRKPGVTDQKAARSADAGTGDLLDFADMLAQGEALEPPRPAQQPVAADRSAATRGARGGARGAAARPAGASGAPVAALSPAQAAVARRAGFAGRAYADYVTAVGRGAAFFAKPGNVVTFILLWLLLVVKQFMQSASGFVPVFGVGLWGMASLVITGWYMGFRLNVVSWAAGEDDELPSLAGEEGFLDGVIFPALRMLTTYIVAFMPAVVFLSTVFVRMGRAVAADPGAVLDGASPVPGSLAVLVLILCTALGLFIWPMFVLVVACGGSVKGLLRMDLMLETIAHSLPAYVLAVLAVYVAFALQTGITLFVLVNLTSGNVNLKQDWAALLFLPALLLVPGLFLDIVAMRAIGYYYRFFKDKFAWSWG